MTKEERTLVIIDRLKKEYPDAGCTLDYNQAWKLLVSVRLAAQCTDARVNIVVEDLYKKFPDVNSLADAPVEEIEAIVKPCGLGHSKARDIKACMTRLKEDYNGNVPDDFNALLKLPGVGRKSANLIMGDVFGKPAIVTDTHCIRLVNRMGLVDGIKEPKKVEMALWKLVPPEEGSDFCHRLVYHGRAVCSARTKPDCEHCCVKDVCVTACGVGTFGTESAVRKRGGSRNLPYLNAKPRQIPLLEQQLVLVAVLATCFIRKRGNDHDSISDRLPVGISGRSCRFHCRRRGTYFSPRISDCRGSGPYGSWDQQNEFYHRNFYFCGETFKTWLLKRKNGYGHCIGSLCHDRFCSGSKNVFTGIRVCDPAYDDRCPSYCSLSCIKK